MLIYMIRHGRTLWNKDKRWQGHKDVELDEIGIEQAKLVAKRLKGCGITTLYSSTLSRARVTAEIIGEELGLIPLLRDDMKEVALGEWEGLDMAQVRERYAEHLIMWDTEPERDIGYGVESYARLQERAKAAVLDICEKHDANDTIALITHGSWLRAFLIYALGISLKNRLCFEINNVGINIISYDAGDGRFCVRTLNELGHISR